MKNNLLNTTSISSVDTIRYKRASSIIEDVKLNLNSFLETTSIWNIIELTDLEQKNVKIKSKIDWSSINKIAPAWFLPFEENIRRIEALLYSNSLEFKLLWFSIWDISSSPSENIWTRKILIYSIFIDKKNLTVWEVLQLFWKYYLDVLKNPDWTDHKNIRALINYGLDTSIKELYKNRSITFDLSASK